MTENQMEERMVQRVEILTAETDEGQRAISEVMQRSYLADIGSVPTAWARVLVADDVPVSFILVDPDRQMAHPGGDRASQRPSQHAAPS